MQLKFAAVRKGREHRRQHGSLDHGGVFQLLCPQLFGLLDFRQPRVFDADRGHVGHHREQAQIVLSELAHKAHHGIQVDQTDHALIGLQRDSQNTANLVRNNTLMRGQLSVMSV